MECPNCHNDAKVEAKFCGKCGSKLLFVCAQCGSENFLSNNFCRECGKPLFLSSESPTIKIPFNEKLARIQRYLPEGLTEKIISQRKKIEGERKQVTVMFCDLENFTKLSARLGPEETYNIMDEIYEILIHKVHDYEGTVNEMTGDGIMALFGAPIALEDAAQRAIRAAYAIHREMAKFSNRLKQEREKVFPLKMRIGIHTGPVVVGTLGNDLRVEFKAVGETVNLASRIEGLAEPGAIHVSEDTFKLTEGLFRFESLGEKELKGKEETVKVYRVIAPSTRRTRFDVSTDRGLTPFIGRGRDLEFLLDSLERAKGGQGLAVSIVAEAGMGKSRLLYEFRKAVANEDVTFLEGRCLSYSKGIAYYLHIDILKANFDIRDGDVDSEIKEKVTKGLKMLKADETLIRSYLLDLLSVKDSGIDKTPISPEARKDRIIETLKRIIIKGSDIRPLILAYEDLHWLDNNSEDVLKDVLESIPGARILLIFTYRPEFVPTWGGRSYHNQLTLNRLSIRESLKMVTHLLGADEIDRDFEDLILEKTEGVPFFIEEFIKCLQDLRIIERKDGACYLTKDVHDVIIPSTIQDVIMARVDSLPDSAKGVLQIGSVIEREFSYKLIQRVTRLPKDELLSYLSLLKDSELVYERGIYPQATYIFKHALTREVIYNSILTRKKRKLHEETGKAIEELYQNNLQEHYGSLAEHFFASGNYRKTSEYSKRGCENAAISASIPDAITHARRRVLAVEKMQEERSVKREQIDARTSLAVCLFINHDYSEAKKTIDPILDLAEREGELKNRLSQIYTIMGSYNFMVKEDPEVALHFLEKASKVSDEIQDAFSAFFTNYLLALASSWNCEFNKSSHYMQKALNVNLAMNNLWGISTVKSHLSLYGYNCMGKVGQGFETSREACQLADKSEDILAMAIAQVCHGISCFYKGFLEDSKRFLQKGIEFCERLKLPPYGALAHHWLGCVYTQAGEYKQAKWHFSESINLRENIGLLSSAKLTRVILACTRVLSGENIDDIEKLKTYVQNNKVKLYEGTMARYLGLMLAKSNDESQVEGEYWFKRALELHSHYGMQWDLGFDYLILGDFHRLKGHIIQAKRLIESAKDLFEKCGADGWVRGTDHLWAHL